MNPYAILGVSAYATDQEIKRAYRILVKRYHPDRQSPEASHDQIAAINYAYDILSDPVKRANYDRGFASIFFETTEPEVEDPVEAYKREYKRKRWEREKKERDEAFAQKEAIYRWMRYVHVAILLFGGALLLRDWFHDDFVLFHWVMTANAAYICYRKERNSFAYRLAQWTIFIFLMTLLVTFA